MNGTIFIVEYKNKVELQQAHPGEKFTVVHQIVRGQTDAGVKAALAKKQISGRVYQVGNFIWQAARETMFVNIA